MHMADGGGRGGLSVDEPGGPMLPDGGARASSSGTAPRRPASGLAVASFVLGAIGVLLSQVPLLGRVPALVLGLLAAVLGGVGVARNPAGARGSRRGLAVAGITLGVVAVFEGVLGLAASAVVGAIAAALG